MQPDSVASGSKVMMGNVGLRETSAPPLSGWISHPSESEFGQVQILKWNICIITVTVHATE